MSTEYILGEIVKNCKEPRRKKAAIDFLQQKMESLKYDDKLRIHLWEIISILKKVEPSTSFDDYD
jgi:hypothetical protein